MSSNTSYSLLLIEDNEADYLQIENLLSKIPGHAYRLQRARTAEEAEQAALTSDAHAPDLCLIGSDRDGTDGIAFISAHSADLDFPPLILLTDQPDPRADQDALDAGAMDYLHKSELTPGLLERSIRHSVARHAAKRELVTLATTDPLTGICNRRTLYDRGNQEFDRATRYGHSLSLVLIDIDHFKYVNDTFGHVAGDKVLDSLVSTILAAIRETDIFGRFGGEEFLLILPHTDITGATQLANRIHQGMKNQPVMHDSAIIEVSVSCGVCTSSEKTEFFDELVVCADKALYQAKTDDQETDAAQLPV
ncbi:MULTISPECIES: GGDEF domain-containing response regulator [Thiorhodovibrio]|uniref:GGDEF domain-containing response regulator n=1 Tax=Thiorhodovibrio TaxID=61593 RepID=UPI0019144759|nr:MULTISPECIES: diguanylate cyclase response regulator [Thiorhodovibrio]MBK5969706.1 hypothetical protein [Thiorhodovibrio winogradskyi]WPL13755.1 Stalked cell differentiation-controlling protein [Thiorhodovibrio litoralis]